VRAALGYGTDVLALYYIVFSAERGLGGVSITEALKEQ